MKKSTQYGKGLSGFFFGLILATGIIAGILFFLNQGNQNVFKELTQPKQSEEPEILKPQDKAEKRPTTDTSSTQADEEKAKAEKAEAAANSGKKAFLQLGSYADRSSADSQRAKLAILGVSSKVVESQNGDKTIYRVQSNTMQQEAAVKLQKNLQDHNINSLIRSTK